jgi:hypothetical protein
MEIMDRSKRNKFMVVCFLPVIVTIITTIYYIIRVAPNLEAPNNHLEIMSLFNNEHGNILFGMLLINFLTHLASLIYCTVHLAKIKHMSSFTKILWIVFLAALMPVSLVVFYFMEIKREPKHLETYPDIA